MIALAAILTALMAGLALWLFIGPWAAALLGVCCIGAVAAILIIGPSVTAPPPDDNTYN
jgi:hypothetical protein